MEVTKEEEKINICLAIVKSLVEYLNENNIEEGALESFVRELSVIASS